MISTYVPKKIINELISRSNIVNFINQRISLKKQGSNFVACCPFHNEKYPSFTVNSKKQFYYCFSCKSYGNIISFLMNYDKLTFIESVQKLSIIHGIQIEHFYNNTNNKIYQKNNIYQFMNDVCNYYQNNLINKKYLYAYKYLTNRGINPDSIVNFKIGFAPNRWNNISQNLDLKKYNQKLINQSGIWIQCQKYKKYDRFRNRIIFPIRDTSGTIIAIGGRIIVNDIKQPKYLNSPDTNIFKKKQHLYGLYETLKKHKKIPYILLVEGYIDVIILTQFGINYVVASLGTSISITHIQLLYNITNQIIFCYDGDYAGKQAAWRTLNIILPYLTDHREIYFMFLPYHEDPDTLIRKIGKDNFLKKISQAQSLSNFLFKTLSDKINLTTIEGRVKLSTLILPMLNKIPGKTLKLCLRQQLGNKIGILDENKLNQLLTLHPTSSTININKTDNIIHNIEHILIGLLIQNPKLATLVPITQKLKNFKHNAITIFMNLVELCKSHPTLTTDKLLEYYHKNNKNYIFFNLKELAYWKYSITDDMITITFIDTLTKLYNLILEQRQNTLIERDRTSSNLTIQERQELWLLNQTLSS